MTAPYAIGKTKDGTQYALVPLRDLTIAGVLLLTIDDLDPTEHDVRERVYATLRTTQPEGPKQ